MRYELIDNRPQKITVATINGMKVSNPTDTQLVAAGIGYEYTPTDPPEVTDETKKLLHDYVTSGRTIADYWQIVDKTEQELIDLYTAKIVTIYNSAEEYKTDGKIEYPETGKEYIPRWVYEFYNAVLIKLDAYFPTPESTLTVTAVDGTSDEMTKAEFLTFYAYLTQTFMTATAVQNSAIKTLTDKIKELRAE